MNSDFFNRLFIYLRETKISFGTLTVSYVLSVLLAVLFIIIRYAICDFRIERPLSEQKGKTRIQMGIELFVSNFMQPYINKQLTAASKEVKKNFLYCDLIRSRLDGVSLKDENLKLRNIRLHMSKKYWAAAVHVILEKMIGEKIPSDSKELDIEMIRHLQDAMSELYSCNQNQENSYDFYFESGIWSKICSHMITGTFFALYYYIALIAVMGAPMLSAYIAVCGIVVMLLFQKRLRSIYISTTEMFMSVPYMFVIVALINILQHFGLIPFLLNL